MATYGDNFRLNVESVRKQNSRILLFLFPKAVCKIIHSDLMLYACFICISVPEIINNV